MSTRLSYLLVALLLATAACQGESTEPPGTVASSAAVPGTTTSTHPMLSPTTPAPPVSHPPRPTTTAVTAPTTGPEDTTEPLPSTETTENVELESGGRTRTFVLFVPAGLEGPAALVLDFHGLTATPERQDRLSAMRAKARAEGFIVAQPAAALVANAWDTLEGSDDVTFALAVVEEVARRVDVDRHRVFATGFSAGGGMAARLGCDAGATFTAVAVVGGAHLGHRRCALDTPVSMIAFYGDADIVVPYEGFGLLPDIRDWAGAWAAGIRCEPNPALIQVASEVTMRSWTSCAAGAAVVLYTVAGGGHGWPGTHDESRRGDSTDAISATDLIWEFFSAHASG